MIYLKREIREFEKTLEEFEEEYKELLEGMYITYKEKAAVRDTNTPIHHRMPPLAMLSLMQAKGRRLESIMSQGGWESSQASQGRVVEECTDIANYALFVGALCSLLTKEEE